MYPRRRWMAIFMAWPIGNNSLYIYMDTHDIIFDDGTCVCVCASANSGIINNPAQQCNAILCQRKLIVYIYSHIYLLLKTIVCFGAPCLPAI